MTQKNSPDLNASVAGNVRNDEMREAAGYRGVLLMRVSHWWPITCLLLPEGTRFTPFPAQLPDWNGVSWRLCAQGSNVDTVNRRSTTNQTKSRTVIKRGLIYIPSGTQSALPVNSRITVVPCFNSGMAYDDNMMTTTPTSHCTYHTPPSLLSPFSFRSHSAGSAPNHPVLSSKVNYHALSRSIMPPEAMIWLQPPWKRI